MESIKDLIKNREYKKAAEINREWLIEHDYAYSPVFGWEKVSVINRFKLDPFATEIPTELKPVWVEKRVRGQEEPIVEQHPTLKKLSVSDNYLAYVGYRKERDSQEYAAKSTPLPEY